MLQRVALPSEERDRFLPRLTVLAAVVALTWLAIFAVRMAGPFMITDSDQQRPAAYTLDVIVNGNWTVQRDDTGDVASKPPLYTWVMALGVMALGGELNELTLYLPGALSVLALALIVLFVTTHFSGRGAGLIAALAYLLAWTAFRQVYLARTDALFSLTVFAAALLVWMAATRQCSWFWFWVMAALATLTKGPLGLLLALGGLVAFLWRKDLPELPEPSGLARYPLASHAAGFAVYTVLCGGWFLLAWLDAGQAFIDKVIGQELVGHAVESSGGQRPFEGFWKQPLYFLSRFLPWSVVTYYALWRVFFRPAGDPRVRLFHRFMALYFLLGLTVFSVAPHQRADHLLPLLPAGAILAGVEVAQWLDAQRLRTAFRYYPAVLAVVLIGVAAFLQFGYGNSRDARQTAEARIAAEWIEENLGRNFPIIHTDGPFAPQFFLNTMYQRHSFEQTFKAAVLHEYPTYYLVRDSGEMWWWLLSSGTGNPHDRGLEWIARLPDVAEPGFYIMGDHLETTPPREVVTLIDNVRVEMEAVRFMNARGHDMVFEALEDSSRVRVENLGGMPQKVRLELRRSSSVYTAEGTLQHGERLTVDIPDGER